MRRRPLARAGVTERTRDAPRSLGRAWVPRRPPFPAVAPAWRPHSLAGEGSVCLWESSLPCAHFAVLGCGFLQV